MSKSKKQKEEILNSLTDKLNDAKGAVFTSFVGLKVKDIESLRKLCRESGSECLVSKKTLLRLALSKVGLKDADGEIFNDEVAVIFSYNDEITAAKIVGQFFEKCEALNIKGGILENKIIGLDSVKQLISIPSKEELYAKLVGSINSPLSGLVNTLNGNLRSFVQVLNSIKEQKS
ncbi:50S ribosomal protein L10 [Candidatus Parcubacteria bacterium]|nr:50S ribosomal protein L10 [Candidatus Parcubacteria bacterium]